MQLRPSYPLRRRIRRPASDVSPRVRTAFSEVRRRVLPTIIQQKYGEAKAAYDRKAYAIAVRRVLAGPEDTGRPGRRAARDAAAAVGSADAGSGISRSQRDGGGRNRDASISARPAPTTAAASAGPAPPRIFTVTDANIVPPSIMRQALPAFPRKPLVAYSGRRRSGDRRKGRGRGGHDSHPMDPGYDNRRSRPAAIGDTTRDQGRRAGQVPKAGPGQDPALTVQRSRSRLTSDQWSVQSGELL